MAGDEDQAEVAKQLVTSEREPTMYHNPSLLQVWLEWALPVLSDAATVALFGGGMTRAASLVASLYSRGQSICAFNPPHAIPFSLGQLNWPNMLSNGVAAADMVFSLAAVGADKQFGPQPVAAEHGVACCNFSGCGDSRVWLAEMGYLGNSALSAAGLFDMTGSKLSALPLAGTCVAGMVLTGAQMRLLRVVYSPATLNDIFAKAYDPAKDSVAAYGGVCGVLARHPGLTYRTGVNLAARTIMFGYSLFGTVATVGKALHATDAVITGVQVASLLLFLAPDVRLNLAIALKDVIATWEADQKYRGDHGGREREVGFWKELLGDEMTKPRCSLAYLLAWASIVARSTSVPGFIYGLITPANKNQFACESMSDSVPVMPWASGLSVALSVLMLPAWMQRAAYFLPHAEVGLGTRCGVRNRFPDDRRYAREEREIVESAVPTGATAVGSEPLVRRHITVFCPEDDPGNGIYQESGAAGVVSSWQRWTAPAEEDGTLVELPGQRID